MGFFNEEVEFIIPPKKQNTDNKAVRIKSLNGYDSIREKIDENDTMSVKSPVVHEKTKPKVSIGL